jgi:hypothetical protein
MPRGVTNSSFPPHLALMKVEIQAIGWFFICSLDFSRPAEHPFGLVGSFWIKPTAKHITNAKTNKY